MQLSDLRQHRAAILALAEQHGAKNIRVFGSVARSDARDDSDVDLLVTEMLPGRDLIDFIELKDDLETLLNRRVDLLFEKSLFWHTRSTILREAVDL